MKMTIFLSSLLLCLAASAASAVEFPAGGRVLNDLPQGPFVRLDDTTLLTIEETESLTSNDNGATWQRRPLLSPAQQQDLDLKVRRERALLRTDQGTIVAAVMNNAERRWTWKNELRDAPGAILPTYAMRSTDGGKTWTNIQKLHDDWSGAVRDMIQTSDGRIIFTAMKMQHDPGRHAVLTYSSDDDGRTWKASNLIDLGGAGHHGGVTEPTLVELADGRIWMVIRTNWGVFWSAYSHDGGKFWRVIQPSTIDASSAPAIIKRLASGRLALVWNRPQPDDGTPVGKMGGDGIWSATAVSNFRGELSLAFSNDEGHTWTRPVVIARDLDGRLSYPYLFEAAPGKLWITTMQGPVRIELDEAELSSPRE